jgi:hypothetical protein
MPVARRQVDGYGTRCAVSIPVGLVSVVLEGACDSITAYCVMIDKRCGRVIPEEAT